MKIMVILSSHTHTYLRTQKLWQKAAVCTACVRAPNYTAGCFNPVAKKRVISFAFYQSPDTGRPRDCDRLGILHNLRLMRIVYPGWRMRIYMRYCRLRWIRWYMDQGRFIFKISLTFKKKKCLVKSIELQLPRNSMTTVFGSTSFTQWCRCRI
jgi:hypothetical protein